MPPLTFDDALAKPELHVLLLAWSAKHEFADQMKYVLDHHKKIAPEKLYNAYLKEGVHADMNVNAALLVTIRRKAGQPGGFKAMDSELATAASKIVTEMIRPAFSAGGQSFEQFEGYQKYLGIDPSNTKVTTALAALRLEPAKAKQLAPLLKVYLEPRSPVDAWQAYLAMQKIVAKSKLDPVLVKTGRDAGSVVNAYKIHLHLELQKKVSLYLKPLMVDMAEAKRYLEGALSALKSKGKPSNPVEVTRMFNSGRMRMDKVGTNYTACVRLDKDFSTDHGAVAADKKKIDLQWAAYKKALGK